MLEGCANPQCANARNIPIRGFSNSYFGACDKIRIAVVLPPESHGSAPGGKTSASKKCTRLQFSKTSILLLTSVNPIKHRAEEAVGLRIEVGVLTVLTPPGALPSGGERDGAQPVILEKSQAIFLRIESFRFSFFF